MVIKQIEYLGVTRLFQCKHIITKTVNVAKLCAERGNKFKLRQSQILNAIYTVFNAPAYFAAKSNVATANKTSYVPEY